MKTLAAIKYSSERSDYKRRSAQQHATGRYFSGHLKWNLFVLVCSVLTAFSLLGCDMGAQTVEQTSVLPVDSSADQADQTANTSPQRPSQKTVATDASVFSQIKADQGFSVSGAISFDQAADGLRITGELVGLSPGNHGFHIHEFGDCSASDGQSAGGHFAPNGNPHGGPQAAVDQRHAGDLGNVYADENGYVLVNILNDELTLVDGPKAIIGKSVIVHAGSDDYTSQPSGDAGKRAGCGVIEQTPQSP